MNSKSYIPLDTDQETQEKLYELLWTLSSEEKLKRINSLCSFGAQMILEDIRNQNPNLSNEELRKFYAYRLWGAEFTKKYFNWHPDTEIK